MNILEIREKLIPYAVPYYDSAEIDNVVNVLKSNWWTHGPVTAEFEKRFAQMVGAKYALAVSSNTAGEHLALTVAGITAGDEVITTPMTFCSTANTIVNCGATPVFVDIDYNTGLIDVDKIEEKITDKTKAIIPVHYAGQCCNLDKINQLAKKYKLLVIEDAAHAFMSKYDNKYIGSHGNCAIYSFYVTKNISTGEGGMIVSDDKNFIDMARVYSLHGMDKNAWKRYDSKVNWRYEVVAPGFKYNTTDISSAIGLAQLDKIEKMQEIREKYTQYYNERFSNINGIFLNKNADKSQSSNHLYIIRVDKSKLTIDRDDFIVKLREYNVGTSVHFIPLHLQPIYKNLINTKMGDFPNTEKYFEEIISLPLYPSMTEEEVCYVADAVCEIANKFSK